MERVLAGKEGVTLQSPGCLADRVTGKPREHDVLIVLRGGRHESFLAIECRDRKRPIGAPAVEAFARKWPDTHASGVMVSTSGYWNTALQKARDAGIRCLLLDQVDGFDWMLAPGIEVWTRIVRHTNWRLGVAGGLPEGAEIDGLETAEGQEIPTKLFNNNVLQLLKSVPWSDEGLAHAGVRAPAKGLFVRVKGMRNPIVVTEVVAEIEYEVIHRVEPLNLYTYGDAGASSRATEVAVANVDAGALRGAMVVTRTPTGSEISFVPDTKGGLK